MKLTPALATSPLIAPTHLNNDATRGSFSGFKPQYTLSLASLLFVPHSALCACTSAALFENTIALLGWGEWGEGGGWTWLE